MATRVLAADSLRRPRSSGPAWGSSSGMSSTRGRPVGSVSASVMRVGAHVTPVASKRGSSPSRNATSTVAPSWGPGRSPFMEAMRLPVL